MKKKLGMILALALCLALTMGLLAGCGDSGAAPAGGSASGGTSSSGGGSSSGSKTEGAPVPSDVELRYVVHGPNTMTVFSCDPALDYTGQINQANGTCETLMVLDDDTKEVKPLLATAWEQTDDTTWVITIRDGVKFSNGKDLTAAAVQSAFEYILANNARLSKMMDVKEFSADGQKLTIKTNGFVAILPRILTECNMLVFDTDDSNYADGLVGTGAFILEKMDADGNMDLVRNENYWQGVPAAAKIHTISINDTSANSNALRAREIDWGTVADSDLEIFENNPDYEVYTKNNGRVYYLYVNPNFTFTADPALREALQYCIDRNAIVAGVYSGHGVPTRSIFPDWSDCYTASYLQPEYNVDTAKKLLADAGYKDSDGDGFLEKDGQKVTLSIYCYKSNNFPTLSEVIQSMLKAIGIDSTITISDKIFDDLTGGQFNIGTYGYNTLTLGDSFNYIQPVFETGASSNFTGFSSPEVDAKIAEMKVTADPAKRAQLVQEMQQYIYASNERIYIMHILNNQVNLAGVKNVPILYGGDNTDNSVLWTITK